MGHQPRGYLGVLAVAGIETEVKTGREVDFDDGEEN